MNIHIPHPSRRKFVRGLALGSAALWIPGAFAEELIRTPAQTEGPFYPDQLPLDTDNDLIIVNNNVTPAVGTIAHVGGRVLDSRGDPVRNAVVEIWQADGNGVYVHKGSANGDKRDGNFQGYGRFLTNSKGEYYFRTIKPVKYPGRTPHIHYKVSKANKHLLTTQCYIKGEPANDRDGVLKSIKDTKQREAVAVDFAPLKESKIGELSAVFDIVLGITPETA